MQRTYIIKKISEFSVFTDKLIAEIKYPCVILLYGDLGAGKTTFTKFLAKKLNIKETVSSPTFVVSKTYRLNKNHQMLHYDFYRLGTLDDLSEIGFWEGIKNNLSVIEWPNKITKFEIQLKSLNEAQIIKIYFKHQDDPNTRKIIIKYE